METKRAIAIAIKAMQQQRQKYAVEANLGRRLGLNNPTNTSAVKIYQELGEAIAVLQSAGMQGRLL